MAPHKERPCLERIRSALQPGSTEVIPSALSHAAFRVALTAFVLGCLVGVAIFGVVYSSQSTTDNLAKKQLFIYLAAWAFFHLLEFLITALYNPTRLFADSFLLQNGVEYHLAHLCGIAEFFLEAYLLPQWKEFGMLNCIGFVLVILGQLARSFAMIHAAGNFSHEVATQKRKDHHLVTDGIYTYSRHPSYAGFFYWALGTQLLLGNPLSALVFAVVLWRFFSRRIRGEEAHLLYFFKEKYVQYRKTTPTLLPFI